MVTVSPPNATANTVQQWVYPVDKKRVNEFGRAYEDSDDEPDGEGESKTAAANGGSDGDEAKTESKKESKKRR